ncbi:hypothetical protein L0F63_000508 [Massospora cicadina]|nr:hypothetical protein L0F63_000508 [Massospora cicadina]
MGCSVSWIQLQLDAVTSIFKKCCEFLSLEPAEIIEKLIFHNRNADRDINGAKLDSLTAQLSELGEFKVEDAFDHSFDDPSLEDEAFQPRDSMQAVIKQYKPTPLERSLEKLQTKLALEASKLGVQNKRTKARANPDSCELMPPVEAAGKMPMGPRVSLRPLHEHRTGYSHLGSNDESSPPARFSLKATRALHRGSLWLQTSMATPLSQAEPDLPNGLSHPA